MALTKLDKNLNIVSALDSEPNDVGGLTSEELKAKFDEGGKAIQEYINETLIPETEAAVEEVRGEIEGAVDEATKNLESQLRGVVLGQIPDDTITAEKLAPDVRERSYTKEEADAMLATVDKIGDIKVSIRTDLGEKWLLCNGDSVSAQDYSELASMFPSLARSWMQDELWKGDNPTRINKIIYANGYWVAVGTYRNGSTSYARLAYTTDPSSDWTLKDLWNYGYEGNRLSCITYANGYWVAGGILRNSSNFVATIAYSADLEGTWKTQTLWSYNSTLEDVNCIIYANGYWVAGGCHYNPSIYYGIVAYTTELGTGWSTNNVIGSSASNTGIYDIVYANGYFVACGQRGDSVTDEARIAYAANPNEPWTEVTVWGDGKDQTGAKAIAYANGKWMVGGCRENANYRFASIAYATELNGPWTIQDLWDYDLNQQGAITCIVYADNCWAVGGVRETDTSYAARIAYATDPSAGWVVKEVWITGPSNDGGIKSLAYANGNWVAAGTRYDSPYYRAVLAYTDADALTLPSISLPESYTYIKAKE